LALLLAGGLAAPAMAAKLDSKTGPTPTTTATAGDIDFGDDTSEWANDGECDDPRFSGTGSAAETIDVDILKDATDCKAAYDAGTVTLVDGGDTPMVANTEIDFGDDSSEWSNDGECDDPRFSGTGSAAETLDADILKDATDCKAAYDAGTVTLVGATDTPVANTEIDFGDNTSEWANDGECDDPRFSGTGSAAETLEADILKDAADCKAAYDAGTVTLVGATDTPVVANTEIDFGDNSSEWANDGECDDPRFSGTGSAAETLDADILKDATDCQTAYDAGTVTFVGGDAPVDVADVDYGDDSSEWNNDGECDDPRFAGEGVAETLLDVDMGHDASDCRAAVEAGTATFNGGTTAAIDYGDDTSQWSNDGECDDPRFSGTGVAGELLDADLGHDATDCRAAVEAGTATFNGGTTTVAAFDYGSDWSKWANDGECDDLRFTGEGVDKKLLMEDMMGDATDCKTLEAAGSVSIKQVYTPEYAAGGPYSTAGIAFGDNSSSYANDDQCDDPRFEGPGTASTLLDSDLEHDSVDCIKAFEAGTIVLREGV
jgi:hypothetical protein